MKYYILDGINIINCVECIDIVDPALEQSQRLIDADEYFNEVKQDCSKYIFEDGEVKLKIEEI